MKTTLIRGVPLKMQQDGWWLNDPTPGKARVTWSRIGRPLNRVAVLGGLLILADLLVWGITPGVSLAVLGGLMILAGVWAAGVRLDLRRGIGIGGGAVLALLPLVELVQPLSLLVSAFGFSAVLVLMAGVPVKRLPRAILRLWPLGLIQTGSDAGKVLRETGPVSSTGWLRRLMLHWAMPLALGSLFALLLLEGNPILMRAVKAIEFDLSGISPDRAVFWALLVPVIWSVLRLTTLRERLGAIPQRRPVPYGPHREGLINGGSIARALILFNVLFAVQTLMDAVVLYGGAGLPDGMTLAQYAHRGAYPLLLTALLAGGFALVSRRWVDRGP